MTADRWPVVRLGWVVDTIVPQRDKPETLDGPIPWLRIEDFDGKYLSRSKSGQGVTPEQVTSMPLRLFPAGTVICSCSCTMGATAIASVPLVTNQTFIGLVPHEAIDAGYLFHLLQGIQSDLQAQASGSIQQYLSQDNFRALRFGLPPLEEQRRIADFLDDQVACIDRIVVAREKQCALVEEWGLSLTQAVLDGVTAPAIPLGWHLRQSPSYGVLKPEHYDGEDGVPMLRIFNLSRSGSYVLEDLMRISPAQDAEYRRTRLRVGDVLLSVVGTIGRVSVVDAALENSNLSRAIARLVPLEPAAAPLIATWLRSTSFNHFVDRTVQGTAQAVLNMGDLVKFRVAIPDGSPELLNATQRAEDVRADVEKGLQSCGASIERLHELKTSLVRGAVLGEFDVSTASTRLGA